MEPCDGLRYTTCRLINCVGPGWGTSGGEPKMLHAAFCKFKKLDVLADLVLVRCYSAKTGMSVSSVAQHQSR